ncbi:MAG: hypothetical protein ABI639_09435 [Thermoanaerobaculia bacterium]
MRSPYWKLFSLAAALTSERIAADVVHPLPYPIVYVRAAYNGANANTTWPDTVRPLIPDAGAELVVLRPNGVREVLFPLESYRGALDTPTGSPLSVGGVSDLSVSFDGHWVLFTWYHDLTDQNPQRDHLSYRGSDLYKLNVDSHQLVRLTHQEFTPNRGNGANFSPGAPNSNYPRIGVFNTGGTFAPGGEIVFTSSRNNLMPPKAFNWVQRVLQLFRMRDDGANVEMIGHENLGMALHPQVLRDGRIAFSSWEMHGIRDSRNFPLWVTGPDGRNWNGLSGFSEFALTHHFMTQMPDGDIVVCRYYNLNNNGFGDLVRYPIDPPGGDFGTADPAPGSGTIPFERVGQVLLTPFTTPEDLPAPCPGWEGNPYGSAGAGHCAGAERRGKFTHPAATPSAFGSPAEADLLAVYAPGPANHNGIWENAGTTVPYYHGEIVLLPDGAPIPVPAAGIPGRPPGLLTVVAETGFNLQWPRPLVAYSALHGIPEPPAIAPLADDETTAEGLVPGEPFGLVGSSSLLWRDSEPAQNLPWQPDRDPFNESREAQYGWIHQGSDAGIYSADDVYAVRILMQQAQSDRTYPNNGPSFAVVGGERMRILGEVPVRGAFSGKAIGATVVHPDGQTAADTSFLVKVPADTSFTFQTLDRRGMVLNMAQTWHMVRPGEARYDCGGCHAHSREPFPFAQTAAAQPGFPVRDLARTTPLLALDNSGQPALEVLATHRLPVEYFANVAPVFNNRCASCHGGASPSGGLDLSGSAAPVDGYPGAYWRLVRNAETFLEPQLTRYLRAFQSRQSLLMWAVWNERLDGRLDSTRGDDLDFATVFGSNGHPAMPGLTNAERMTLARWIDLGAPIHLGSPWGYLEDDLRPTLVVRPTEEAARALTFLDEVEVAAFDVESGVVATSLEVVCDRAIGGSPAGTNLAAGQSIDPEGGKLMLALPGAIALADRPTFTFRVRDSAGQVTEVVRRYGLALSPTILFIDGFASGSTGAWSD